MSEGTIARRWMHGTNLFLLFVRLELVYLVLNFIEVVINFILDRIISVDQFIKDLRIF